MGWSRSRCVKLVANGRLTIVSIEAISGTEANVVVTQRGGTSKIVELLLSPDVPALIQWYDVVDLAD